MRREANHAPLRRYWMRSTWMTATCSPVRSLRACLRARPSCLGRRHGRGGRARMILCHHAFNMTLSGRDATSPSVFDYPQSGVWLL